MVDRNTEWIYTESKMGTHHPLSRKWAPVMLRLQKSWIILKLCNLYQNLNIVLKIISNFDKMQSSSTASKMGTCNAPTIKILDFLKLCQNWKIVLTIIFNFDKNAKFILENLFYLLFHTVNVGCPLFTQIFFYWMISMLW